MKANKGFTLIELLAVIVILAVIALIATPLVMSTINEAKKGAAIDSAYGYINALEQTMLTSMISNTSLNLADGAFNGTNIVYSYSIMENNSQKLTTGTQAITVSYKGTNPTSINLTIKEGKVVGGSLIVSGFKLSVNTSGSITAQ